MYVQIDVVGGFTAAAGACLYNGGAWPERFNNTFFVSEPTVSLVHQDVLTPKGASYVASKDPAQAESEFIAGTDLWFRPIHTRVGPDGALYVIDFYNQAAIHNDTRGPKHGANNAATRPDRDHHFGRIWRVQHKEAKPLPPWKFDTNNLESLVTMLEHPNGWVRGTAERLLLENGQAMPPPSLQKLASNRQSPEYARVQALWAMRGMLNNWGRKRLPDPSLAMMTLKEAIEDTSPAVRKNALRILDEDQKQMFSESAENRFRPSVLADLKDTDARVRLQALVTLGAFTPNDEIAQAVVAVWPSLEDKYLESAAVGVAAKEPVKFIEAALAKNSGAAHEGFAIRFFQGYYSGQQITEISIDA